MKFNVLNRKSGGNAVAVAACLLVVMGWGSAEADYTPTTDGYKVDHFVASPSITGYFDTISSETPKRGWKVSNVNGVIADDSKDGGHSSFLILKKGAINLTDEPGMTYANGTYTVKINLTTTENNELWRMGHSFAVFRYMNSSNFYAVSIDRQNKKVYFNSNSTSNTGNSRVELNTSSNVDFLSTVSEYTIKINMENNVFIITVSSGNNNVTYTPHTVTGESTNKLGQVGYGHSTQNGVSIVRFISSELTGYKSTGYTPPGISVPEPYSKYYVWNLGTSTTAFTGGSGNWSGPTVTADANWSNVSSGSRTTWANLSSALFYTAATTGGNTVTVNSSSTGLVQVANIAFYASGYTIDGSTLTLSSTSSNYDTITVVGATGTAAISAVLASTNRVVKSGAGTLTLSGTNTYSDTTIIIGGKLVATKTTALGTGNFMRITNAELGINIGTGAGVKSPDTLGKRVYGSGGTLTKTGDGELVLIGTGTSGSSASGKEVATLKVEAGTLTIPDGATVTVNNSFSLSGGATLRVGIGNTPPTDPAARFGTQTGTGTVSFGGGTLNVFKAGAITEDNIGEYLLFDKAPAAAERNFGAIHVNGVAWNNTTADFNISVTYTEGVKLVIAPKGTPTLKYTLTTPIVTTPTTPSGGTVSRNLDEPTGGYDAGTPVQLTATPAANYDFINWSGHYAGVTNPVTINVDSNMTITANFRAKDVPKPKYKLTVSVYPVGGGTTTPAVGSETEIEEGTPSNITATPDGANTFSEWTSATGAAIFGNKDSANTTVTLTGDATITANFTPPAVYYTLTITQAPNGTITADPPVTPTGYLAGTEVKLTTSTTAPFVLGSWGGDITGTTNPYTITMNDNMAVTAEFVDPRGGPYTLTFETNLDPGCAANTVSRSPRNYSATDNRDTAMSEITLSALTNPSACPQYTFSYWSSNGVEKSDTFTVIRLAKDTTVKAYYNKPSTLPKLINIESASYAMDTSMMFTVKYSFYEDYNPSGSYSYYYELRLGGVKVRDSLVASAPVGAEKEISIRVEDVLFDTAYTIYLQIMDSKGEPESEIEWAAIEVGEFNVQRIRSVGSNPDVTNAVSVDNGRFILDTKGWENSTRVSSQVFGSVTVYAEELSDAPDGFIELGVKGYKYVVNANTASFTDTAFTISMMLDAAELSEKAPGYSAKDVRLYRYANGGWSVAEPYLGYEGGYVTAKGRPVCYDTGSFAYRLMINTKRPVVKIGSSTFGDTQTGGSGYYGILKSNPINPGSAINVGGIGVTTNVANTKVTVKYAVAKLSSADTVIRWDTLSLKSADTSFRLEPGKIGGASNVSGVLVYMIINNGSVSDTINMSRQASLPIYTASALDCDKRWTPLGAKVSLGDPSIDAAFLETLFRGEEVEGLPIDDMRYRLVRWLPKPTQGGDWVSYMGDNKPLFEMANGRLMWLRTKSGSGNTFTFNGEALTASLTDTFTFVDPIPPKQWVDFILPFDFSVKVKDVLLATTGSAKSDSLYFFTWNGENDNGQWVNYSAERLYVWDIDDADRAFQGPFTVYNNYRDTVRLRVPPRPALLSGSPAAKSSKMAAGGGFWYYAINAAVNDVSNIASLRLGYYESERVAPAPPTLGNQSVVILSDDGWHIGDYLTPELSKGGRTFKLRFINGDKQKAAFKFSASSVGVPEKTQLMFVDALTGEILGGPSSERLITVAANSYSDVYAIVGSRDYLNKTAVGPAGAKFAMGGITVNQAARSVRIKYYVPLAGADRVEVSVYNLKGRLVWKNAERVRKSSWNTMEWRARESRGGAAAAGLYLIRVRALNAAGKTTAVENRRITFAR